METKIPAGPRPPPQSNPLVGSWVGSYGPFELLFPAPPSSRSVPEVLSRPPRAGCDYAPSAAIIVIAFKKDQKHFGEIRLNFGGVKVIERSFTGTYNFTIREDLETVTGDIDLTMSAEDQISPGQNQAIYFVMRGPEELEFMLIESETSIDFDPCDENPAQIYKNAGAAAVHGTLRKVLPIEVLAAQIKTEASEG